LSLFALHLGASAFTVGLIIALLSALPMVFSIHAGRVIDRIGVRAPMLTGAAVELAGIVLIVAWPRLEALFIASCLIGSGIVLFYIAVMQYAGLAGRPEDRALHFSLAALGFSTSGFIGPMVAGFGIDLVGHRWTFVVLGGFALVALAGVILLRIDTPAHGAGGASQKKRRLTDLLKTRTLREALMVTAVLSSSWDLFTFVVPIHGSHIGLSASQIGLILGAFGAAIFAVRLALPLFVRRLSEWQLLIAAMFITGPALLVFPLVKGMPLLMLLAFLLGIGLGGAQPMVMSLLYSTAPEGRGAEAVGLRTLIVNASQFGIPLVFGALGTAVGMTPVFWAMATALLGSGWVARRRWQLRV
jgi:predicted MFS family arabinose efflux permease